MYKELTDKEIIENLDLMDFYEASCLIRELKKENTSLKSKLTKLKNKHDKIQKDEISRY